MSDEDGDEEPDGADNAEEVSQDDEAEAEGDAPEALPSSASLDGHASESEDEYEASESLAEEEALEAEEDSDSQPGTEEDDSTDAHEVDGGEDVGARGAPLDSTALRESLASRANEEDAGDEQELRRPESRATKRHKKRKEQSEDPDSLQSLKRQLTEAKRQASEAAPPEHASPVNNADSAAAAIPQV